MTTIRAESYLKMIAWLSGRIGMGEQYPEIDLSFITGIVESSQAEWRTVWPGNSIYQFSIVPENMYVSSSSALDVGRVIFVSGLDELFNRVSGYGITNGQNQVIITTLPGAGTPVEFFRVNSVLDITPSLSPNNNANGDIYIAASAALVGGVPPIADTRRIILQGQAKCACYVFTVPAGYTLFNRWFVFSQSGAQQINVRVRGRAMELSDAGLLYFPDVLVPFASIVPGVEDLTVDPCVVVMPERTDYSKEIIGTSPVSGEFTIVSSGELIDNKYIKNLRRGLAIPGL